MAERVSAYLGEEAIRELDRLCDGLGQLSGCEISRSAAIASLLVNQAGLYLETRRRTALVVGKYLPGGKFGPTGEDEYDPGEHFMDEGRFGYDYGPYAEGEEAEE